MDPSKILQIQENRKIMRLNMKSHILKNIKKAKDKSDINSATMSRYSKNMSLQ
jgi:hypothetical protein